MPAGKKKKSSARKKASSSRSTASFNLDKHISTLPPSARSTDPTIPADPFRREALDCYKAAARNLNLLKKLPDFDINHVHNLKHLIPAFEQAQRMWDRKRIVLSAGRNRKDVRKEAEELRTDILTSGRYLFRNNPEVLLEFDRIGEGEGVADLVTDLRDLVVNGKDHASVWKKDVKLPKNAFARAEELADMLDETVDPEDAIQARERRNQIAALIDRSLDEIRAGARYALRGDHRRLAPFLSRYEAAQRARNRKKAAAKKAAGKTATGASTPA